MTIFGKFTSIVTILAFGVVAGIGIQQKVLNAPIPDCICPTPPPPPTVQVQPFDVEKIKNLREFTYAPKFTGSISVAGVDSSSVRIFIEESVMKAFEKHVVSTDKKKRK